jgi:hypothetical protein
MFGSSETWSSNPAFFVEKNCGSGSVQVGSEVDIVLTIVNNGSEALRGFYLSEAIPSNLSLVSYRIVGIENPSDVHYFVEEIEGTVIKGAIQHRWIFEIPPELKENNSIEAGKRVKLIYTVKCNNSGYFDLKSIWVGRIGSQNIFGYANCSLIAVGNTPPATIPTPSPGFTLLYAVAILLFAGFACRHWK